MTGHLLMSDMSGLGGVVSDWAMVDLDWACNGPLLMLITEVRAKAISQIGLVASMSGRGLVNIAPLLMGRWLVVVLVFMGGWERNGERMDL